VSRHLRGARIPLETEIVDDCLIHGSPVADIVEMGRVCLVQFLLLELGRNKPAGRPLAVTVVELYAY
jgi:hypothetical protein